MERIHIFHTNDVHSRLDYWSRTRSFLIDERARYDEKANESYLAFDIGDYVDRVHPLAEASQGQAMVDLLNDAAYDAATLGNNEGIGLLKEDLNALYDRAQFPLVLSNLVDAESQEKPDWSQDIVYFLSKKGTKIACLGLTFPFYNSYAPHGWQVLDPIENLKETLANIEADTDIVVLLSHLGIYYDRQIAEDFQGEIDLIIGGHTHHVLPQGEWVGDVLITGAGSHNDYVGEVVIDYKEGIRGMKARIHSVERMSPAPREKEEAQELMDQGNRMLEEDHLADLPRDYSYSRVEDSESAQLAMEALKDYLDLPVAVSFTGLYLGPFEKGTVTRKTLHDLLPHSMRLAKVQLQGHDLRDFILDLEAQSAHNKYREFTGVGFRGKEMGVFCYNGIEVKNGEVYWLGETIKDTQAYTFATVDFFLFSTAFPIIREKAKTELVFPLLFREVVGLYLKKEFPIQGEEEFYESASDRKN